jgi:hypothetical protein
MSSHHGKKKKQNFSVTFANGEVETMEIDNYCFTRINKYLKLKRRIKDVLDLKVSQVQDAQNAWMLSIGAFFTGSLFQVANRSHDVENYWSADVEKLDFKQDYQRDSRVFEVIILQRVFRIWIFLSRLRKQRRNNLQAPKTYVGETQTKEQKEEIELREKLVQKQIQNKKKLAAKFCRSLVDGKYTDIRLYAAGQSGMRESPLFRFSKDYQYLQTTIGSFELKNIYDVQIGLTYDTKRLLRLQDEKCLHLKLTGKIVIEIEAKSNEDASQLFTGFKVLRNCLMSMHSFSVIDGLPRRLVSTVIEKLIQDGQAIDIDESKSVNSSSDSHRRSVSDSSPEERAASLNMAANSHHARLVPFSAANTPVDSDDD